jgi:hypothetical protein
LGDSVPQRTYDQSSPRHLEPVPNVGVLKEESVLGFREECKSAAA